MTQPSRYVVKGSFTDHGWKIIHQEFANRANPLYCQTSTEHSSRKLLAMSGHTLDGPG